MSSIVMPATAIRAGQLKKVEQAADAVGLALPKPYRDAAKAHRDMLAGLTRFTQVETGALAEAVLDAITDGRDPLLDDTVTRGVAVGIVADQQRHLLNAAGKRESAVIAAHRAAIMKAATKPVAKALEAIRHAAEVAPGLNLTSTPQQVIDAGTTASATWTEARDAQKRVDAYTGLLRALGYRVESGTELWLTVQPAYLPKARTAWQAALEGGMLSPVETIEEHRERIAEAEAIETERARAHAAKKQQAKPDRNDMVQLARIEADQIRRRQAALQQRELERMAASG